MSLTVKANSLLAEEFHHHLGVKSTNLRGLVCVPYDFIDMRGHDNKTTKTELTDPYYIGFGYGESSSYLDRAARTLYKALESSSEEKAQKVDLLQQIQRYFENSL